jgi:hypothetical protein
VVIPIAAAAVLRSAVIDLGALPGEPGDNVYGARLSRIRVLRPPRHDAADGYEREQSDEDEPESDIGQHHTAPESLT